MKILVVDFIYYVLAHRRMNCDYINAILQIGKVTVLAIEGFYKSTMFTNNVELLEIPYIGEPKGGINQIKDSLYITKQASRLDKERKFDVIFALTYDTRAMAIGRLYFSNPQKIYLMNHYNIDANEKLSNYCLYNTYKNKIKQLVLEPFFRDVLVSKYKVKKENLFYIPHKAHILEGDNKEVLYDCVGISNSNDEAMIHDIIELEERDKVFEGKRVVLKSKNMIYEDENLKVINGYVSDEEYATYINCAKQIFMPFPRDFKYRLSGTLYEALAAKKKVITTDILLAREYSRRYSGCCSIITTVKDFIDAVKSYDETVPQDEVYDKFMSEHSEEEVIKILLEILCK